MVKASRANTETRSRRQKLKAIDFENTVFDVYGIDVEDLNAKDYALFAALETEGIKICLGHLSGLKHRQIAEMLDIPLSTVDALLVSPLGKAFLAKFHGDLVREVKSRLYSNLDRAMQVIEDIIENPRVNAETRLKAATMILNKALPDMDSEKKLELLSNPDFQVVEASKLDMVLDRLAEISQMPSQFHPLESMKDAVETTSQVLELEG